MKPADLELFLAAVTTAGVAYVLIVAVLLLMR